MADGIPMDVWSGSGATKDLHRTILRLEGSIDKYADANRRHAASITLHSYALLFLTIILLLVTIIQIVA